MNAEPRSAVSDGHRAGLAAAQRHRLPFGRQAWRGQTGGWQGSGVGSSIDFQDHRAYALGDDPRHIHWAAYARTGLLTMKLHRAEVAPMVEVVADVSASMTYTPAKAARLEALVSFCVESAAMAAAPVRIWAVNGRKVQALPVELVRAGRWRERLVAAVPVPASTGAPATALTPAALGSFTWRPGAMKILISDLLFPGDPAGTLAPMAAGTGLALVFAPALAAEAEAPARGNAELLDCESPARRLQQIDEPLAIRFRAAYARHFALWSEACRRRAILFARIPCEGDLGAAFAVEARPSGVVEIGD